ncbi:MULTISPECIES: ABC transporter substrate-binding protein [Calothrix]|uniref:ABC transporter substrate-binding protein n=2 Tax=Calothrix TaxID=1186 RepID=A0ABR8ABT3_9CYAN|nr:MULTISPECIES: CHAT domain-containing protein [Calothrix]MBD2197179.1 ABC transporter substrate-binding protein [Calothrix parietina FACHB-288]MBD2225825.1 ABC transporter substrate-binding protein [Calothrix anomala FACHB-343]
MAKVVKLNIINGDFAQGFTVQVEIRQKGRLIDPKIANLPPAPDIPELYHNFQEIYNNLDQPFLNFQIPPDQNNEFPTIAECREAARRLEMRLEEWFDHPSMKTLRIYIEQHLRRTEPIQVIFQTDNEILKKLPWHLWDLFEIFPKAWFSLSTTFNIHQPNIHTHSKPLKRPVRILAILGSDQNTDPNTNNFERDGNLFNNLPGARVKKLPTPTRQELCQELQNEYSWDIVCFSGHSWSINTNNDGQLQINPSDSPSMRELRNAFRGAIRNGLKLVIFSSCDGSGLANKLMQFQIPQVIIMRELVPDEVAYQFLKEFLQLFSQGELFYLAVRKAQENLQSIENQYPCASWLPVIYQNPAAKSPVWPHLINIYKLNRGIKKLRRNINLAIYIFLFLICCFIVILFPQIKCTLSNNCSVKIPNPPSTPTVTAVSPISTANINPNEQFFSRGQKTLISPDQKYTNREKEQGINSFENKQWKAAIDYFSKYLKLQKNDPETLIYLNNAIAELRKEQKNQNYITIAVSVPMTKDLERSENILRGVAHAQSRLNCGSVDNIINVIKNDSSTALNTCKGGINKQPLVVEIVDDQDNADNVAKLAENIIKLDRNILAVIGHYSSKTTIASLKIYNNKIVVISPSSTSSDINEYGFQIFRTTINDNSSAKILSSYVQERLRSLNQSERQNLKFIVAYTKGNPYSDSLKKTFQNSFALAQYDAEFDLLTQKPKDILKQIETNTPTVLLLITSAKGTTLDNALTIIEQVSQIPNPNLILIGGDSLYHSKTKKKTVEKSNLVLAVPWHSDDEQLPFNREANNLWGNNVEVDWRNAMAYDATQAIIAGLTQINLQYNPQMLKTYRQQLKDKLLQPDDSSIQGATKPVIFTQYGERIRNDTNSDEIGVLVKVKCTSNNSCKFVKYNLPKQP